MRISDDRYSRDRLRLDIAMHFIRHEARTRTIRQWTGLTDDRIRKLYRSYHAAAGPRPARHRGRSPQQSGYFLRTARLREHSAALASLCGLVGLISEPPAAAGPAPAATGGIARAALLCQAYEAYRHYALEPAISFEHAVLLLARLQRNAELRLSNCRGCGALRVGDGFGLRPPSCNLCAPPVTHVSRRHPV
jgi:hypothetical protein